MSAHPSNARPRARGASVWPRRTTAGSATTSSTATGVPRPANSTSCCGSTSSIVFSEVKTRRTDLFGPAAAAVGRAKQRRIRLLALEWLRANDVYATSDPVRCRRHHRRRGRGDRSGVLTASLTSTHVPRARSRRESVQPANAQTTRPTATTHGDRDQRVVGGLGLELPVRVEPHDRQYRRRT